MKCATEDALYRHQEKLAKQEASLELLMDLIDDDLVKILDLINKVKGKAVDFDGYDFGEEVKDALRDLI